MESLMCHNALFFKYKGIYLKIYKMIQHLNFRQKSYLRCIVVLKNVISVDLVPF